MKPTTMESLHFEKLENGGEITLEKLGLMIGKGFAHNDKRFDIIESRLDHLDARVGRIEADIQELRGEIVYRHACEDVLARVK